MPYLNGVLVELIKCSACKCQRVNITEYEYDRHGRRRKCCIQCKKARMYRKSLLDNSKISNPVETPSKK